ncbi:ABC transporter ATP-binding protein [Chengkuizengella axinellae]|uniref:ABC transporter ATP-binding protein n=1 Tax=Chengkuizengella axinellae TaxID=3064388 RepID=A0ABT9J681_9BACL|nr:ABC transporter ATP-binding protein [Chengkuizengella sp. 2205SS18-9]MDP5277131.1 ABC transporter ATP-binding protein [Chengkuizengella sp. 2205SS18-9]
MEHAVKLNGITHVYVSEQQALLAIENIDLTIKPGEFVSFVGPSGCGKTTILSILAGLIKPSQGSVSIFNNVISGPSNRTGYMLQHDYLFPWRTILNNAIIGLEIMKKLDPATKSHTKYLLNEMGLSDTLDLYPDQLSGGMRQRVALVRTLATQPDIFLLDEPFSALDFQTKLRLEDLVFETLREHSKTAILVTHDISEAVAMSDRIVILNRKPGRIHKIIEIPNSLRSLLPFEAREEKDFRRLFHEIWRELENIEQKGDEFEA